MMAPHKIREQILESAIFSLFHVFASFRLRAKDGTSSATLAHIAEPRQAQAEIYIYMALLPPSQLLTTPQRVHIAVGWVAGASLLLSRLMTE
jgi:hypothetical protein